MRVTRITGFSLSLAVSMVFDASLVFADAGVDADNTAGSHVDQSALLLECEQAEENPALREQLLALPVQIEADELLLQEEMAIYQGDVNIRHNCIALEASNASLDISDRTVKLSGEVRMQLPQAELTGDGASFSLVDNSSSISGAEYHIDARPGIFGSADLIEMDAQRRVSIDNGSYTRCEPDDKDWEVTAGAIRLNTQTGQGSARNAVLRVANAPVLYVPYMRFPIGGQRQSGFLFPEITSRSEGIDLVTPYYFNLAPNYDLLFRPRYKAGSGYITEFSSRWLNGFDSWKLDGLFIDSDQDFPSSDDGGDSRWLYSLEEASYRHGHWATELNLSRSSDEDVLRDLQSSNFGVSRSSALVSSGRVRWRDDWGELGLALESYQSIDSELDIPSEKRPELWSDIFLPLGAGLPIVASDSTYTYFDSGQLATQTGSETAERVTGDFYAFYPFALGGSELEIGLGSEYRFYNLEENTSGGSVLDGDDSAWINVPYARVEWQASVYKSREGGGIAAITPSLSYRARVVDTGAQYLGSVPTVFDSAFASPTVLQLYAEETSIGGDFIESRDTARASVNYSVANGRRQLLSAELGAVNYFARALANGEAASIQNGGVSEQQWFWNSLWQFHPRWRSSLQLFYSEQSEKLNLGSTAIQYRVDDALLRNEGLTPLFNLAYHFRRDDGRFLAPQDIELVDTSAVLPIGGQWGVMARFQYDLQADRHSEALAGVEFDGCCIKFRLVYRDGIIYDAGLTEGKRDRAVVAQIQLKGLGGVGQAVDALLEESIRGFGSY